MGIDVNINLENMQDIYSWLFEKDLRTSTVLRTVSSAF